MYIYALNGESYWTACACFAVQHFIHTNPYNFANMPSPSNTHEMLLSFQKFSLIELARQFYPTATALIIWIEIRSSEVRRFHQRLNILFFGDSR